MLEIIKTEGGIILDEESSTSQRNDWCTKVGLETLTLPVLDEDCQPVVKRKQGRAGPPLPRKRKGERVKGVEVLVSRKRVFPRKRWECVPARRNEFSQLLGKNKLIKIVCCSFVTFLSLQYSTFLYQLPSSCLANIYFGSFWFHLIMILRFSTLRKLYVVNCFYKLYSILYILRACSIKYDFVLTKYCRYL